MNSAWNYHSTAHLRFGWGAAGETGEIVRKLGLGHVLVITDQILERHGLVEAVTAPLKACGIANTVFTGGEAEPTLGAVLKALEVAQQCKPQGIIGLGGGSNMDMAKIVATVLRHGGCPTDFAGEDRVPGPILPVICLPTTAGTGSEVSSALVFTDPAKGMKGLMRWCMRLRLSRRLTLQALSHFRAKVRFIRVPTRWPTWWPAKR